MLEVARACQHLCTLSCKELYIGRNDGSLKQILSICSSIVNLDLHSHHKLCDTVLIEALRELPKLHSLNLRGCCRLTDKSLKYVTRHYSSTLKVLYLDHSVYPGYVNEGGYEEMNEIVRKEMKRGKGGYTAARIAKLRKRCTQLHTFHYIIEAGTVSRPQHVTAYQMATIVQLCAKSEDLLPIILKHCKKMQILAMTYPQYGSHEKVSLTPDELVTLITRFPRLRMIVNEKCKFCSHKDEVDYSAVREAFPKVQFVENTTVLNFDALEQSV